MNTNRILAESIAKDYAPKQDSKIKALKRLDARAKRPARVFAYTFGTVAVLVAGAGMSFAMDVIGTAPTNMLLGIILGVLGFTACGINYPIYTAILKKNKEKYAFEIVELAREICSDEAEG